MTDSSTKPYLMRAIYEWCVDQGYTPYLAVKVDGSVQVPREFVRDGEIVLNISMHATGALEMKNDAVRFKARFGGISRDIYVPIERVMAIYANENGQGMGFDVEEVKEGRVEDPAGSTDVAPADPDAPPRRPGGPSLRVVK